jgi:hypothetical protein
VQAFTTSWLARPRAALLVATLGAVACGDAGPTQPNLGPPAIELVYQGTSAERPLEQLLLHSRVDNYKGAQNQLATPLMPKDRVVIEGFSPGGYHLTVIRKKLSLPVSDMLALTTETTVSLQSGRYEIWVFDESFRVYDPVSNK